MHVISPRGEQCPDCGGSLRLDHPQANDFTVCTHCGCPCLFVFDGGHLLQQRIRDTIVSLQRRLGALQEVERIVQALDRDGHLEEKSPIWFWWGWS